jgi:hypothetical protein
MAGTRELGDGFETTDEGLHLHEKLVKTERTALSIVSGTTVYSDSIKVETRSESFWKCPRFPGPLSRRS